MIQPGVFLAGGLSAQRVSNLRGDYTANDVWVVDKNREGFNLKSSDVVLVSKRTGQALYEGSACDEG